MREQESLALDDIDLMLASYADALELTRKLHQTLGQPGDIDGLVKVNDKPALRGLKLLANMVEPYQAKGVQQKSRSRLLKRMLKEQDQ